MKKTFLYLTKEPRRKEVEAPRERPRARKKVIRAPAVSQSLERTNLREKQTERHMNTSADCNGAF